MKEGSNFAMLQGHEPMCLGELPRPRYTKQTPPRRGYDNKYTRSFQPPYYGVPSPTVEAGRIGNSEGMAMPLTYVGGGFVRSAPGICCSFLVTPVLAFK